MKKTKSILLVVSILALSLTGCAVAPISLAAGAEIAVTSREDGSGTRGAFVELFDVRDENKVDITTDYAEITNNTAVMMTTVSGDENAIGYISLGSLNDTVKVVAIDGVLPSVDTVIDGTYTISRPFMIATKGDVTAPAQAFIDYILSADGQAVALAKGYITIEDTGAYANEQVPGKVVVAGSSSVTPLMEALKEAYLAINPNADIEVQQSDSTTGMNSIIDGICDIGMASREIKDSEAEKGALGIKIAVDGIAVIVNLNNPVESLSKDQVKGIYTGEITLWSDIAQ